MTKDKEDIVSALRGSPKPPLEAKAQLPKESGFYSWWVRPGAIPEVPTTPHPSENWCLLYVGIAPGRATSSATLSSRVRGQHINGNTGSSTFRLSLASLLFEREGWQPLQRKKKAVLSSEDNAALREWQQENAALCWCVFDEPWAGTTEGDVIAEMKPPLNLAENSSHPFHETMTATRRHLRASAI